MTLPDSIIRSHVGPLGLLLAGAAFAITACQPPRAEKLARLAPSEERSLERLADAVASTLPQADQQRLAEHCARARDRSSVP